LFGALHRELSCHFEKTFSQGLACSPQEETKETTQEKAQEKA
jgi:hypothetical protein